MAGKLTFAARILLGLIFVVFGSNGLVMIITGNGFIPMPPPAPEMTEVMNGLFKAGYLMPLVKGLETVGGLLLLLGIYKRLALVLLVPIIVNIAGLHFFVDPAGAPMGVALIVLAAWLIKSEWTGGFAVLLKK